MNCSGACALTFEAAPALTDWWGVESIGSTLATVSLNSKNFNGNSTAPALLSFKVLPVSSDGSNYFGDAPLVASSNIQFSTNAFGLNIAASSQPLSCPDSSGSGTAQSCTTTPTFTPTKGSAILYTTTTANTGALTINVDASSAAGVYKWAGSTAVVSGDIPANVPLLMTYDGAGHWDVADIGNAPGGSGTVTSSGSPLIHELAVFTTATNIQPIAVGATNTVLNGNTGADPTWGALPLGAVATQAANTVVMNATAGTAAPTAVAMPTCTTGADLYNTSTNSWSCVSTGGTPSFPVTVAGTVTSGGIPYFNSTTQESSSAAGAAGTAMLWGGAGAAPTATTGTLALAGNFATTGAFNTTIAQSASITMTLPGTSFTAARTDAAQTFTGIQTFSTPIALTSLASTVVNATSPGAGIAHFAGSTQTVTSSAVSLTADVSGVLPFANMSQSWVTNAQTATYQVLAADFLGCKTIPVASGTFTITLVASGSQPASGQCIEIVNYGSGVLTLARSGQLINGAAANLTSAAGSTTTPSGWFVISDGTNYIAEAFGSAGGSGTVTSVGWVGGIVSVATATTTPAFTIAGTSGGVPYFNSATTWATSAALAANVPVYGGGAGAAPVTGLALGSGTGTAGHLACATASNTQGNCTGVGSMLGVFISTTAYTAEGIVSVVLDATENVTFQDNICASSSSFGTGHDNGATACLPGQAVGVVTTTASSVSSATVSLRPY
jgi:hypothetical protein